MGDENVTFLGGIADSYDGQVRRARQDLDWLVEHNGYSITSMVVASTAIAFMEFSRSMVDILRVGNGARRGTLGGVAEDGLRVLTIIGVSGAVVGRVSRLLVVTQRAGTVTCGFVSTAQALRTVGARLYAPLSELFRGAGVTEQLIASAGTNLTQFRNLFQYLRQGGVAVREIAPASQDLNSLVSVLSTSRNGVMQIAISVPGSTMGHILNAVYDARSGVRFLDTNGHVFTGIQEFLATYQGYSLAQGWPMIFYENTILITIGQASQWLGGFGAIGMEVRGVVTGASANPSGGAPPRSVQSRQ